ncbi:hypothetical protein J6590_052427 [Homalodisca vitripennis]|nr:hypothetical protein J6590_052427 [Homalodisca vitripennis]
MDLAASRAEGSRQSDDLELNICLVTGGAPGQHLERADRHAIVWDSCLYELLTYCIDACILHILIYITGRDVLTIRAKPNRPNLTPRPSTTPWIHGYVT